MAQINTYGGTQVRKQITPSVQAPSNATAASFGDSGTDFMGTLGRAGEKVGLAAYQGYLRKQKEEEDQFKLSKVRDAVTQARNENRGFLQDVFSKKGKDASEIYPGAEKYFMEQRKKYEKIFAGDETSKNLFKQVYDSEMDGSLDKVSAFQSKAREDYKKETAEAANLSFINEAVTSGNGKPYEADVKSNIDLLYKNSGMPAEFVEGKRKEAVGLLHHQVLMSKAEASPKNAQEYLKENWESFDPKLREKMKSTLKDLALEQDAHDTANAIAGSGTLEQQLEKVDKIKDVEKYTKVRKFVIDKAAEIKSLDDLKWQRALEGEVDQVFEDPGAYKVPLYFPAKEQEHLYNLRQKMLKDARGQSEKQVSDMEVYYKLTSMPQSEFNKANLLDPYYANGLNPADLKTFMKAQRDNKAYQNTMALGSYVSGVSKKLDEDEAPVFKQLFEDELNKFPEEDRKKMETWNKVKDNLFMEMDVDGRFWDSPYWKMKSQGAKGEPDTIPDGVPSGASWVDKTDADGRPIRGWVHDGMLYGIDKKIYRMK